MSSCSLTWFQLPFSPNKGEISVFIWPPVLRKAFLFLKGLNPRVTFFLGLCVTLSLVPTKAGCGFDSQD